eukprot:gene2939-18329_t
MRGSYMTVTATEVSSNCDGDDVIAELEPWQHVKITDIVRRDDLH